MSVDTSASHSIPRHSLPVWLALIILSTIAAAALQQPSPERYGANSHATRHEERSLARRASFGERVQDSFFGTIRKPTKSTATDTTSYSSNERAIATWAPTASFGSVVRAPPAVTTGFSDGLSTPRSVRSLQDWEVEDFVLLATVDGTVYATDRNDGTVRWSFEADKAMVETVYHQRNGTRTYNGIQEHEKGASIDDFLWIVEPSQDGNIYIYRPGTELGLQSLGMTVRKLAEEYAPYASEFPSVVYTAEKKNVLFTLDAANGTILQNFRTGGMSAGDDRSCRKASGLTGLKDNECEALRTLTLARTDYAIGIQSRDTGEPICTIRYFEWTMNNKDKDLQSQHLRSKDNRYIYNSFDGSVAALDHEAGPSSQGPVYQQKFPSPVVQIFDVGRLSDDTLPSSPLVVLPQPAKPLGSADLTNVFLNCTETGSWYALSESSYPLVTSGAPEAQYYSNGWPNSISDWLSANLAQQRNAFTGLHPLGLRQTAGQSVPALPAPSETLSVDYSSLPSPDIVEQDTPWDTALSAPSFPYLVSFGVMCLAFIYFFSSHFTQAISGQLRSTEVISGFGGHAERVEVKAGNEANMNGPVPGNQISQVDRRKAVRFAEVLDASTELALPGDPGNVSNAHTSGVDTAGSELGVDSDNAPQLNPAHSVLTGASLGQITISGVDESEDLMSSKPKKKAHRGQRGGRKLKKASSTSEDRGDGSNDNAAAEQQVVLGPAVLAELDSVSPGALATDQSLGTRIEINNLIIHTDLIRGSGSGGTFVFDGEFEGREVAVKRMLPQFYEMKNQEVSLLRQSEDHDNVIRYYCERTDANFLYIALELCQASLWDLFRDGERSKNLQPEWQTFVTEILSNGQRMLYQLAAGLNHLHSLRIIHRDIKPQNILIAYPKKRSKRAVVRLVISDFGLCKTLPENASTLIGATGNAGTQGWKAPELILLSREDDGSQQSQTSNGVSANSINGDMAGSQGVKRAVDVFSLGCVFFYIVTGGRHPFEDKEGYMGLRERNIKKNKADLSRLSDFKGNDTEEALDIITWMLENQPEYRPTAEQLMRHPFFWSSEKRLNFLCDVSDHFEHECRDPPSAHLNTLEVCSKIVFGDSSSRLDFLSKLDKKFIETLGKQRKYNGDKMLDLLRALRNKKNHYADMPLDVQQKVGPLPEGYLRYWISRFPALLRLCYHAVMECRLEDEPRFRPYFQHRNDWLLEL